jgi:hypothetical protein
VTFVVRIKNIYGDITTGRQDNAVYQRKYGRGMRRAYKEVKPASSPLQKEQNERFKSAVLWIKSLTNDEKDAAKQYCKDHHVGNSIGEPIHWYNWLKNFVLSVPKFTLIDSVTNRYKVVHPGIFGITEFDSDGNVLFDIDDLTNLSDQRFLGLYEQVCNGYTSMVRVTTISGNEFEFFVSPSIPPRPDFLSDWNYYVDIPIVGSPDGNLSNYTMLQLVIDYVPSKMNSDFSDIRFSNFDCTVLYSHTLVSKIDEEHAVFDIMIPSIPSVEGTVIKCFYGNPNASDSSNPDGTYLFSDFFDSSQLNTEKWTVLSGTWTLDNVFTEYELNAGNPMGAVIETNQIFTEDNVIVECKVRSYDGFNRIRRIKLVDSSNPSIYNSLWMRWDQNYLRFIKTGEALGTRVTSDLSSYVQYHVIIGKINDDWYVAKDGSPIISQSNWLNISSYKLQLVCESYEDARFDDIKVYKVTPNPPSFGEIGEEQSYV